ncbi:helix-turn-helix transcriptional regulator [[Clostridium] aminophilum]|uniref:helix-turn-helix transcriptional regulator n=1 Tax=[Clostridium] aminophilum TaxID=1526 RepID=UPI003F992881
MTNRRWLTRADVADLMGVSTWTVDKLARDGKLRRHKPTGKPQGRVVYSADQVERLISRSATR